MGKPYSRWRHNTTLRLSLVHPGRNSIIQLAGLSVLKAIKFTVAILVLFVNVSCSQQSSGDQAFSESDFTFQKRGEDSGYPYVVTYVNKSDSSLVMKQVYFDSLYSILLSKIYYHHGVANGPYAFYLDGKVHTDGTNVNGRRHGKRTTYKDGRVVQEAYFKDGLKTGIWIEYDLAGRVIKKTYHDENGNVLKNEKK